MNWDKPVADGAVPWSGATPNAGSAATTWKWSK